MFFVYIGFMKGNKKPVQDLYRLESYFLRISLKPSTIAKGRRTKNNMIIHSRSDGKMIPKISLVKGRNTIKSCKDTLTNSA